MRFTRRAAAGIITTGVTGLSNRGVGNQGWVLHGGRNYEGSVVAPSGGASGSAMDRWGRTPLDEATAPNNPSNYVGRVGVRLQTTAHVEIANMLRESTVVVSATS